VQPLSDPCRLFRSRLLQRDKASNKPSLSTSFGAPRPNRLESRMPLQRSLFLHWQMAWSETWKAGKMHDNDKKRERERELGGCERELELSSKTWGFATGREPIGLAEPPFLQPKLKPS